MSMAALLDPMLLEDSVLSFCGGIAIGMIACLIILGLFGDNKYVRWALYFLERAGLLEAVQRTGGSPPFVHNDEATRLANTHHYIVACHETAGDTFELRSRSFAAGTTPLASPVTKENNGTRVRSGSGLTKHHSVVYLRHPQDVHAVLTRKDRFHTLSWELTGGVCAVSNLVQPAYERTFFQMAGDEWLKRRSLLNPVFVMTPARATLFARLTQRAVRPRRILQSFVASR